MEEKKAAHDFLHHYEKELSSALPPAGEMERWIRTTCAESKEDSGKRHLKMPEAAFLNHFAIPELSRVLTLAGGLSEEDARHALLNEYHRSMKAISDASPARSTKHPFTKALGTKVEHIYEGWADEANTSALVQSCPDFALRRPFPHKIVFEGKYFSAGSLKHARNELVRNIYQAFFYRGLPFVPETSKGRAAWDYDYSCLLAYDSSVGGTLKEAWQAIPKKVRDGFWSGANIYVMILGGEGRTRS